ncbi:phosphatidylserine decarboxylase [Sphingomonas jatrophae]|uniref:Phosphatidylserine decarboxylase proenzyme n=1 Tax=Sphingomonas jatrophae TaxID=1166337 RepID=A0A1I6JPP8_9SPHN|nr:phosphatidylserine decarboxylase [Sphingomonas jatrophae]SFR80924.1 phosphatidylserine decarboxylase [Sphingomonas jatrophae]
MASLDKPDVVTTNVKWRFPSVHPKGRIFVLVSAAATLVMFAIWDELAFLMVGLTIWVAAFFRDPVRAVPQGADLIISPADGLVTMIADVPAPREMVGEGGLPDGRYTRVSIFMSVFDVHINRSPITGTVRRVVYISGRFLNADLDKASEENERQHLVVEGANGIAVGFTQIAGLVARRIVPFVKEGDMVAAGQRIGLIRFGSRVDVYLPAGTAPKVTLGQRVLAGETIIGRLGEAEPVRSIPQ